MVCQDAKELRPRKGGSPCRECSPQTKRHNENNPITQNMQIQNIWVFFLFFFEVEVFENRNQQTEREVRVIERVKKH